MQIFSTLFLKNTHTKHGNHTFTHTHAHTHTHTHTIYPHSIYELKTKFLTHTHTEEDYLIDTD
jgi:hypothetical protein